MSLVDDLPWADNPVWRGVDCGEGWEDIIRSLHADLVKLFPDYKVIQVKEKFGGLRYYVDIPYNDSSMAAYSRIGYAENESLRTCEVCGEAGTTGTSKNNRFWIRTLCDKDREALDKQRRV